MAFRAGMKIYSIDWYLKYGLNYDEAAELLADQGISFVIAQNRYIPMADSAVKSEVTPEQMERYSSYDDRRFVQALRRRGIEYWAACNLFFDPAAIEKYDAYPIDESGKRAETIDWYLGACPNNPEYLEDKIGQLEEAVAELRPDGVFLGFTRFPGFWELWLPHKSRWDFPEYCFCSRCLDRFQREANVLLPAEGLHPAGEFIRRHAYPEYVSWKGDVIAGLVRSIRERLRKIHPEVRIMLNTLPFAPGDFENAGVEVFGQDWNKLADVVDVFELMTYHQILGQGKDWVTSLVGEFRSAVSNPLVCTIQAAPLYLDGMHAGEGRKTELTPAEFREVAAAVKESGAHGVVLFTWSDFLRQTIEEREDRRIQIIRELTR